MMNTMCNNFKKTVLLCTTLVFILGFAPLTMQGQVSPSPLFGLVEFMKTTPGNEGNYVELELNTWKKLHQARIDKGLIVGWYLYKVHYTASDDPYNYVTVTLFSDKNKLENPWADIDPAEVLGDIDVDKVFEETMKTRKMVGSNLMNRMEFVFPEGGPGDFKYLQLDYMKVKQGHDSEYYNTEVEVWKPIHNEFIKAGSRVGWSLWGRVFPSGYGLDFQYVTVNYFSNFAQIGTANYNDATSKAHPNEDVSKLMEQTNNSRLLVKSELWEVIDRVMANQ
ncbi:hypothetical protein [Maribellus sediminis]|uniref:hypothetical protein n=1 Tax=Maribellus sediminis TaxID=2696285 RepID=UPI00142F810A|nr:hypothetical protein [Maribellus sediminis]